MKEVWKNVVGYEGLYQVSNFGKVKSLNYRGTGQEKILKTYKSENGYYIIGLYKDGKQKMHRINRLVAFAFIPNPNNLPEVNHKDENKENNCVNNLEWCDRKYNVNYGTGIERMSRTTILNGSKKGAKHPQSRKIICITTGDAYDYIGEAAEKFNIPQPEISQCCQGIRKSAGKQPETGEPLRWAYYDEFVNPNWYNDEFANPFWFMNEEIIDMAEYYLL